MLLLNPEEQAGMVVDEPEIFSPVPGGWGRNGSTRVLLAKASRDVLAGALRTAWQRRVQMNSKTTKGGRPRKAARK